MAREFFHSRHIVNRHNFNLIWWDGVESEMKSFPKMFRNFVTKQVSKFCGTNRQLSRIDPSVENICPSCGQQDESSRHITRCRERGRVAMLQHSVDEIVAWMTTTPVSKALILMVRDYLLAQIQNEW